ncbi:hypothetical protein CDV36_010452 [Fusarium kuroshium]|uniref:Uncharacterized protein n=1 Tax=Fusarium kuroshium TaxID=2010991 RepID=A0A3M2RXB2_9HYPO|nr:hypothetical protein CDV36_010452 [Fusarium kuroshium]
MFSSSPPKGPSGQGPTTRNQQPATPSRIGANVSQPNPSVNAATQLTPSRATQLAQAGSPNTPFGISSSSESSESDFCEIQHVQPSPNRKRTLPAADQRVQPSKKAKTKQAPSETSAVNAEFLPQPGNSSDCFIEKVLPSPKRRQQTQPQLQSNKRSRIDRAGNASALVSEENDRGQDSECEIVYVKPSPNRLSLAMLTSTDSDADDERPTDAKSRVLRKIATPKGRVSQLKPADNCLATKEPTAAPSSVPNQVNQSIVIDLSQLITSDSDSSAVETSRSAAHVTQALPAQGEPTVQSDQSEQSATDQSTAAELAPSPEENSQSQHQSDPESDDIMSTLIDYLDSQLEEMKKEKERSSSSDGNEPSATVPEPDSRPIKEEICSGTEGSDDDYDDDEQHDDEDEDNHDEAGDDRDDDHDDEDTPTLIKMEDAADSDSSSGLFVSSPPVSYQLPPAEEDSPKPVKKEPSTESEDESSTGDFNDETLNTSVSSFKDRLAASYKLQPVYSGDKLSESNEPGTPGSFQPHHRDSLVGLKSILKRPQTSLTGASGDDTEYSSSPNISPPSRSRRVSSSPTERIQGSKKQAKALRPSARKAS